MKREMRKKKTPATSANRWSVKSTGAGVAESTERVGMKEALPPTPTKEMREELILGGEEVPLGDIELNAWSAKINTWIEEVRRTFVLSVRTHC